MWPLYVLCFLVGLTISSANPAWKENVEYSYNVRGRTLASLHEVSHQYSGILFKASLKIQPKSHQRLQAQLFEPQYAQVHSQLRDGWNTEIPEIELTWRPLKLSSKPFQIGMKQGFINDLRISKETPNWEANIIKSVVSQFQLNIHGGQSDRYDKENSAVFVTMEDTVTGNTETLYKVSPLPDYIVENYPNGAYLLEQKGEGHVYEVIKHKNYSNNIELPSYFYGFGGLETGLPATNKMGDFFVRNSVSRSILTGNMRQYTIQQSSTVNEVIVNPTLTNRHRGGVFSQMNVALQGITPSPDTMIKDVFEPVLLGNLVYTYEKPSSQFNYVQEKIPPSIYSGDSVENYKNLLPEIEEAPESPLLPYTVGYKGKPVKREVNIVDSVVKLAREIGYETQNPERMIQNNTLNKFTILSALLKIMNVNEIKKATNQLYDNSDDGSNRDTWNAFRDCVTECGTGPALLVVQAWIQTGKINGMEASIVLSAVSNSARQPTLKYMKTFFDIVKNSKVQSQWPLNDTALLSYSQLVNRVYGARKEFKKQYPVKSFYFDTKEGMLFMKQTIIPYYNQELHKAILHGKTHRTHVLIRSLGNIGHPLILSTFEPYLEGKKQVSQYQRLLMVVSMDELAQNFKNEAKSVLFRIYQNIGESQEIRVAAVYQLMRIHPDAETLQLMAAYTNIDKHEHVNAAIKSSIESFSELGTENPKMLPLYIAAQQAKPLLTNKIYGIQYGANYLRSRFIEELGVLYKESSQLIGSTDHYLPKGIKYSLRKYFGGVNKKVFSLQFMVSSIDELVQVLKQQTEQYSEQQSQQKASYNEQKMNQWSCQNISDALNMRPEELEQLEGSLYLELGYLYGMVSFDNMTINRIPEEIRNLEDQYRHGKKLTLVKIINERQMALSFPTETGLPFVFTYDTPTVINVKGVLKALATPQIFHNNKINIPDSIQIKPDLNVLVTRRIQSHVSFITPFDHQHYIAGFDQQGQFNIPIQGKYDMDLKNMQIKMEIEPRINEETFLYHFKSIPYTSRVDITKFEPVVDQLDTRALPQTDIEYHETTWGEKETGLTFQVQTQQKKSLFNYLRLKELFNYPLAGILDLLDQNEIQHSQISIKLLPQALSTQRIVINLRYYNEYRVIGPLFRRFYSIAEDPMRRQHQQNIMENISSGIRNVKIDAVEAKVNFQGDHFIEHDLSAAVARSSVDPKSRLLLNYKKVSDRKNSTPYSLSLDIQNEISNIQTLDLQNIMQSGPEAKSTVQFSFGTTDSSSSKIQAQFNFKRSTSRKQYLQRQPKYLKCQHEISRGDKQLPACANQTVEANYFDIVEAKIEHHNLPPQVKDVMKTLYHAWRLRYFPFVRVDNQPKARSNQIDIQVYFDPDLRAANVSVKTPEELTEVTNIKINDDAKRLLVVHPEYGLVSRLTSQALKVPYYTPFCVVDKTRSSTFNNNTFQADISKHWTIMLQYVPKRARYDKHHMSLAGQMTHQTEHYTVLVRESLEGYKKKDIKITLSSPRTGYKVLDITMIPRQDNSRFKAQVTVNGETVKLNQRESYNYQNGYIEIYGLPNGEIKFEIEDGFYVVYDGTRVKLVITAIKFKNAVRGVCGQYNDEQGLYTAADCVTFNSYKFVKSYEIDGEEGEKIRQQFRKGNDKDCVPKSSPFYIDVVTNDNRWKTPSSPAFTQCTHFQSRYVEQNGEICFTTQALPLCQNPCRARRITATEVAVHCVQQSNAARLWKEQIDKGGNPDFSHKTETKMISLELPQGCSE